jgi:hypothetical protein
VFVRTDMHVCVLYLRNLRSLLIEPTLAKKNISNAVELVMLYIIPDCVPNGPIMTSMLGMPNGRMQDFA